MTAPIRTTRLPSDPQACGGRIVQPWLMQLAARMLQERGLLIIPMHHPKLDEGDHISLRSIASRLEIIRKDTR